MVYVAGSSWPYRTCWRLLAVVVIAFVYEALVFRYGLYGYGPAILTAFLIGCLGDRLLRSGWSILVIPFALNLSFAVISAALHAYDTAGSIQGLLSAAVTDPVRSIAQSGLVVLALFLAAHFWNFGVAAIAGLGALLSAFLRVSSSP